MTEMLQRALKENYAVGQFNINGLLWVQAILQAAEEARSPVILAASDRLIEYLGGVATIASMVKAVKEELEITVPGSARSCMMAPTCRFKTISPIRIR